MEQEYNKHLPVLVNEVLSFVPVKENLSYLDLTLGRGMHAKAILDTNKVETFVGVDRDSQAIEYCEKELSEKYKDVKMYFLRSTFKDAVKTLKSSKYTSFDFILMDIGVSSPQFDDPKRGFSYRFDSRLDMRMDQSQKLSAYEVINTYSEEQLNRVFSTLGECKEYKNVSKKIVEVRKIKPIETTLQLVEVIKDSLSSRELNKKGHPAKQFFLGLRYEVNDEINQLKEGLESALSLLCEKGRLAIISFNSEEDKVVKDIFKKYVNNTHIDKYSKSKNEDSYSLVTKKPILPTEKEIEENNRCKSSILRVIERRN